MSGHQNPESRDLPPYRAILVVDARSFSERPSAQQAELSARVERVLHAAFVRAGLADAWVDRRFAAHTGDGYIVGLPPERLPHLLHPLLRELQAELHEEDLRRSTREPRLRLRASIHVGPVPDRGLANDGVGKPMTDTHRLLDCDHVRRCLGETHEDVTFLAAIVSERAYADAVEGGYTGLHPAQFIEVVASAKRFTERAYLHVPQLSGHLLRSGLGEPAEAPVERPAEVVPVEPARTVRDIGDQLLRRAGGRVEALLAGRESAVIWIDGGIAAGDSAAREIETWFRGHRGQLAECALLIAAAVLDGASHHAVAAAADDLHDRLWAREHPGEDGPGRAVFDVPRAERLAAVAATTSGGQEHTAFGASPADVVTLANPSWRHAVLRHVWREYDLGRHGLGPWLRALGQHPQADVRARVAAAVGELAGRDFVDVCGQILEPWARDDREEVREVAAIAAGVAAHGHDPSQVRGLLAHWARADDRRAQWTAATAFGGRAGLRFPSLALERLEAIVEEVTSPGLGVLTDQEVELLAAAGGGVRRLFEGGREVPELHRELLGALLRWTDRRRPPAMVIVAEFIFLHLAMHSATSRPEGGRQWPAVLRLMEEDERARELAQALWSRCLGLPETRREAVRVLEAWGELAGDEPASAGAVERLVGSLAREG